MRTVWGWRLKMLAAVLGLTLSGCGDAPAAGSGSTGGSSTATGVAAATPAAGAAAAAPAPAPAAPGGSNTPPAPAAPSGSAGAAAATSPTSPAPALPPVNNPKGVFAVSPVYTIMADGKVSELADGAFGDLAKHNNHFDAATGTIHLYGIRNQEVAAQLVIPWQGEKFFAQAGAFDQIPADRITFSWIAYDAVVKNDKATGKPLPAKHYPDVIVPLDGSVSKIISFDVPQKLGGLPEVDARQGLILMEVWIPKNVSVGTHNGSIQVMEGDTVAAVLHVQVHAGAAVLPDRPTFRMDYLNYGSPLGVFGLDSALGDGAGADLKTAPDGIRLEQSVHAQVLDNRGFLNVLPYSSQRGNGRYAYPFKGTGADAKITSFDGFDARFGDLLSGKLGKYQVAPACFTLAFNLNYPYTSESEIKNHFDFRPFKKTIPEGPGKDPNLKIWEDTYRAIGQQTLAHFAEKGWKNTAFEIYYNQKPADNNRTPWKLDEPVETTDYIALRYLLNVGKWAFEGAADKSVKVISRVDIGHWECDRLKTLDGKLTKDYKSKDFNTGNAEKILKPVVDRWVAGLTHVQGAQWLIPEYNTDKVMFDTYGGAGESINHGGEYAGCCWIYSHLGVEGKVIYKVSFAPPDKVTDDTTMYSAKGLGVQAMLCSRRVKLWRDSINDFDLLAMAGKKDPAAVKALLEQMLKVGPAADPRYREESHTIQTYFNNNVEDIAVAERIAAALAAGETPDAGLKIEGFSKRYVGCGAADTIVGYD